MYRYFQVNGLPDVQDIFIQHALTGKYDGLFSDSSNRFKALIMNFYAKEGRLAHVSGLDDVEKIMECGFILPMCTVGTNCRGDKAILDKLAMIHLYGSEKEKLLDAMEKVNQLFVAEDINGNDMVYDRMCRATVSELM